MLRTAAPAPCSMPRKTHTHTRRLPLLLSPIDSKTRRTAGSRSRSLVRRPERSRPLTLRPIRLLLAISMSCTDARICSSRASPSCSPSTQEADASLQSTPVRSRSRRCPSPPSRHSRKPQRPHSLFSLLDTSSGRLQRIDSTAYYFSQSKLRNRLGHLHLKEGKEFIERIGKRLHALSYHMRTYFWLDFQQLNVIYRYKTEEYSHTAVNKFNVIPDSIPDWLFDFMPTCGGYFIGNVSPARMDFRWFALGNFYAILSCLATPEQSTSIMDLIEERWDELVGEMPLKIAYPAIETHEWQIVTGCDPKNTRWSCHNGGSWPVLLWMLTATCIKTGRPQIARKALDLAENRLLKDGWPEYYDGKLGRYIGKQARKFQTWSIAGYLVAKMMLEDPSHVGMVSLEEDKAMKPVLRRSASWTY